MKRVGVSGAAWLAMVAIVAALAANAAEKFVIALPNGYEMSRAKAGAVVISKRRGKVVVPGPVKAYAVVREAVVGQLDVPEPKEAKGQDGSTSTSDAARASDASAAAPAPAAASPPTAPAAATPAPAGGQTSSGAAQGGGMRAPGAGAGSGGGRPAAAEDKPAANPVFSRPPPSPTGRYFVLDTKTGEVGKDLSLAEWQERLKKFDITSAPQLAAPILPN